MFIEASFLIAPNVGGFLSSIDNEQRTPTKEELEFIINFLTNTKEDLYPEVKYIPVHTCDELDSDQCKECGIIGEEGW